MERAYTEPFTIGRGIQATLHVDSGRVSRLHAEVVYEDGGWVLRDAGSTNGTYYNEQRVERVPLAGGETAVRLGREGPFVYLAVAERREMGEWSVEAGEMGVPVSRRRRAQEDTQRQSQPYRPLRAEEPTTGHDATDLVRAASARGAEAMPRRTPSQQRRVRSPRGTLILAGVLALLLLAILLAVV
ncbi:MAG: FHA domain-containing protein [Bacteroidota bacterium]